MCFASDISIIFIKPFSVLFYIVNGNENSLKINITLYGKTFIS